MFKKVPRSIVIAALLGLLAWVAWHTAYPSGTWRYKMTVVVETPEGIKTGSSVREVHVQAVPRILPAVLPEVKLKGEAVVVDLGARGTLFGLLTGYKKGSDYGADIPAIIFSPTQAVMRDETIRYMSNLKAGPQELPVEWYPMFVRFREINDPKTVENLRNCTKESHAERQQNPVCTYHFEEAFGKGVSLKSVTIEMTDENITWEIDKRLPWLKALKGGYLHGGQTSRGAPLGLYGGNFQTRGD